MNAPPAATVRRNRLQLVLLALMFFGPVGLSFWLYYVNVDALELCVHFDEGEEMLTEISAKFRLEGIKGELAAAGLLPEQAWTDPAGDFALVLARAARS